ncbi:MAG: cell division protein CrgA [Actinomycetota bacterium]
MAPPKRRSGGRTTPKGTRPQTPRERQGDHDEHGVSASSRYTPPVPEYVKQSPTWVPVLMFALFILGTLVILLYYLGAVPGGRSNIYLLVGLGSILGGLYTATKYH